VHLALVGAHGQAVAAALTGVHIRDRRAPSGCGGPPLLQYVLVRESVEDLLARRREAVRQFEGDFLTDLAHEGTSFARR
jgi:hypothetical protein